MKPMIVVRRAPLQPRVDWRTLSTPTIAAVGTMPQDLDDDKARHEGLDDRGDNHQARGLWQDGSA